MLLKQVVQIALFLDPVKVVACRVRPRVFAKDEARVVLENDEGCSIGYAGTGRFYTSDGAMAFPGFGQ